MDKIFRKLKIDEELRDLLPPQTEEEHRILEESILKDGCIEPIKTWNDYIVDGHNRYEICEKYNIGFEEYVYGYENKQQAINSMLENQLGRRNLTDVQRIIIAEKYRRLIEEQAKENQKKGGGDKKSGLTNSTEPISNIDTRKELAKIAGVGIEKYYRTNKILKTDDEEVKDKFEIYIELLYKTWNGDIKSLQVPILKGLCEFIKRYRKEFNKDTFIKNLVNIHQMI